MLLAFLLAAGPTGTLTLDRDDPVVAASIDGVPLRLRVALDQHAVVELAPATAARLTALPFEADGGVQVGRVTLNGRVAPARLTIAGRIVPVTVSSYAAPCCPGVDGTIPPDLLPYADIRFTRPVSVATRRTITLRMERRPGFGLFTRTATTGGPVLTLLTLADDATLATAAGAAALARAGTGRFTGPPATETRAFGVPRPVRTMLLDRPVVIAGLPVDRLLVRTTDYRGDTILPAIPDGTPPADIRVTARAPAPQRAIAAVTLGRDRLNACPEIRFQTKQRLLTLFCTGVD